MFARSSLSVLRTAARQPVQVQAKRAFHPENVFNHTTPFDQTNGAKLGIYIVAMMGGGFSIPFLAAAYQIHKASA
ncbi:hypothetical protein JCM11641_003561 [Rhodosporidiobolus odoratus]